MICHCFKELEGAPQASVNQLVVGSIPTVGANFTEKLHFGAAFLLFAAWVCCGLWPVAARMDQTRQQRGAPRSQTESDPHDFDLSPPSGSLSSG